MRLARRFSYRCHLEFRCYTEGAASIQGSGNDYTSYIAPGSKQASSANNGSGYYTADGDGPAAANNGAGYYTADTTPGSGETITSSGYVVQGTAGATVGLYSATPGSGETITSSGYVVQGTAGATVGLYSATPGSGETITSSGYVVQGTAGATVGLYSANQPPPPDADGADGATNTGTDQYINVGGKTAETGFGFDGEGETLAESGYVVQGSAGTAGVFAGLYAPNETGFNN
jgi:hypothetical protein